MKVVDDLLIGWFDCNIRALQEAEPMFFARFKWVLVCTLDSTADIFQSRLGREAALRYPAVAGLGKALLVPGQDVPSLVDEFDFFQGFDEVWCFGDRPTMAKPDSVSIVSPARLVDDGVSTTLVDWMKTTGCQLGLGDGDGMNVVTPSEDIATMLTQVVA